MFDDSAAMVVPPSAAPSVPPVKIDLQIPPSVVAACKQVRALLRHHEGSIQDVCCTCDGHHAEARMPAVTDTPVAAAAAAAEI